MSISTYKAVKAFADWLHSEHEFYVKQADDESQTYALECKRVAGEVTLLAANLQGHLKAIGDQHVNVNCIPLFGTFSIRGDTRFSHAQKQPAKGLEHH